MDQPAPWVYLGLVIESGRRPPQPGQVQVQAIIEWAVAFSAEDAAQIFRARIVKGEGALRTVHGAAELLIYPLPAAFSSVAADPASNAGAYQVQLVPLDVDEDALADMQG